MKTSIISGIILLILGGIASKYIFNDHIELNFLLSDRIPTSFLEKKDDEISIQQLELINSSEVEIDRIIIKIKSEVIEYDIRKVSSKDSLSVTKSKNLLEIIYPTIPVEAKVRIIIKTQGKGISINDLQILHNKGSAKHVSKSLSSFNYFDLVLRILFIIIILNAIKSMSIDTLRWDAYYSSYDKILTKTKPWYISSKKWKELRDDAIKYCFEKDYSSNITNSISYKVLNNQVLTEVKPDELEELKQKAQDKLIQLVSTEINKKLFWNVEALLVLKQPNNTDDNYWYKITDAISQAYIVHKLLQIHDYFNDNDLENKISEQKPTIIKKEDWNKYIDFLEKFRTLRKLQSENKARKSTWHSILYNREINENNFLNHEDLEEFKKIKERIFDESKKIEESIHDIKKRELVLIPKEKKLEKQLKIIHEVLNDPTTVDRIEEYLNPFAIGNFKNLKKLAKIHAKSVKSKK